MLTSTFPLCPPPPPYILIIVYYPRLSDGLGYVAVIPHNHVILLTPSSPLSPPFILIIVYYPPLFPRLSDGLGYVAEAAQVFIPSRKV